MKRTFIQLLLCASLAGLVPEELRGQVTMSEHHFTGLNLAIPDGDLAGVVDAHDISGLPTTGLRGVTVGLGISGQDGGGFTGDLYVALWHLSEISILLNRAGRTATNPFGYADTGDLDVTFADSPSPPSDIHLYRDTLGSPDTPLPGPLTGIWAADARTTDPLAVLDTDPRTAGLGLFTGADPNGLWALHVVDASTGAVMQLDNWSLYIALVPEPASGAAILAGFLTLWALLRPKPLCGCPGPHADPPRRAARPLLASPIVSAKASSFSCQDDR